MSKIKLTEAEQFIMEVIWSKEKAFMKDIMEAYDDPKPASTTLATVLKRMQDKNLIGYETVGNSREYYSLVKKRTILQWRNAKHDEKVFQQLSISVCILLYSKR